jgi:hypothetical protein
MKKQLLVLATALLSFGLIAQDNVMNKGDMMINAGIGFGFNAVAGNGYNPTKISGMTSIHVSGEKGMFPTGKIGIVTLGGSAGFGFGSTAYSGGTDLAATLLFRGAWHLSALNNTEWDAYAGAGAGVQFGTKDKYEGYNAATNQYEYSNEGYLLPGYVWFLGGRWMMKDNMGLFGEVGVGSLSNFRAGITFKL